MINGARGSSGREGRGLALGLLRGWARELVSSPPGRQKFSTPVRILVVAVRLRAADIF
jgi:hypothetical protein